MPETKKIPLEEIILESGFHNYAAHGMCVMEAVSYIAGETFSAHPECCCRAISSFLRCWNDHLTNTDERTRLLRPLIPKVIGTVETDKITNARVWLIGDWMIRECIPAWLNLTDSLKKYAVELIHGPDIIDYNSLFWAANFLNDALADARKINDKMVKKQKENCGATFIFRTWDTALISTVHGASEAACNVVRWAETNKQARTIWEIVKETSYEAAKPAAYIGAEKAVKRIDKHFFTERAWFGARDALNPTKEYLQQSAIKLVHRLINVKEAA